VRLKELGYQLSEEELNKAYQAFLKLADKKKEVYDEDLRFLMGDEIRGEEGFFKLEYLNVSIGTDAIPKATVRLMKQGKTVEKSAEGDGPVDAVFNAIDQALDMKYSIEDYQVRSVTSGRTAMGEVHVTVRNGIMEAHGRGVSTDIIEASGKAYLQAVNMIVQKKNELMKQGA
jgi:2-isopropylmalate synthase